jgi:endonuclease/exonuclease/phosphatase (EEP) superfamily protein YafD
MRNLCSVIVILLLLAGCVKIPERHNTLGTYNELNDFNTECLWNDKFLSYFPRAAPSAIDELNSLNFTILNWNIHKGSSNLWLGDFERLSTQVDLMALQEGYLTHNLVDLLDRKQYHWDIAKAFTYNDIYSGVLTASRVKPDFLCSFRFPEPLSGIPKTVLMSRYPLSDTNESLLLVNIHMINISFDIDAYRAQIEKISDLLTLHNGPLILAGDFNTFSSGRIRILDELAAQLDLTAVAFETDNRALFMGQAVDHIYYRQLVPLQAVAEKVTTSDHNPMMVTFKLTEDE